jgi:hypothetical protein
MYNTRIKNMYKLVESKMENAKHRVILWQNIREGTFLPPSICSLYYTFLPYFNSIVHPVVIMSLNLFYSTQGVLHTNSFICYIF